MSRELARSISVGIQILGLGSSPPGVGATDEVSWDWL